MVTVSRWHVPFALLSQNFGAIYVTVPKELEACSQQDRNAKLASLLKCVPVSF